MPIKLIVGLGNPGSAYEATRHNTGFWYAEHLVASFGQSFTPDKKFNGHIAKLTNHCRVLLPQTYMNESGMAVQKAMHFYKIEAEEVVIAHDELDLPPGTIKLKSDGGHGGHNGLRDIIQRLGSKKFHRLRIGIGHPGHKDAVLNYVLAKPSASDRAAIIEAIDRALNVTSDIIKGEMQSAMHALHS